MVDDRGTDRDAAVDRGGGRCRNAGLLERDHQLRVEPVRVGTAIAEADDVELHRRQDLELGRRLYATPEALRELTAARDGAADPVGAVHLESEPGLERAEAARE